MQLLYEAHREQFIDNRSHAALVAAMVLNAARADKNAKVWSEKDFLPPDAGGAEAEPKIDAAMLRALYQEAKEKNLVVLAKD